MATLRLFPKALTYIFLQTSHSRIFVYFLIPAQHNSKVKFSYRSFEMNNNFLSITGKQYLKFIACTLHRPMG